MGRPGICSRGDVSCNAVFSELSFREVSGVSRGQKLERSLGPRRIHSARRSSPAIRPTQEPTGSFLNLFPWRVLKRQLGIAHLLDFNDQSNASLRSTKRERLPGVLVRNRVQDL